MEISVQSGELIEALSERIASMTVELETTRLALRQAQEAIVGLEQQAMAVRVQQGAPVGPPLVDAEGHPVL
jgi:hypothetical protein